jgi:hypothetical protein
MRHDQLPRDAISGGGEVPRATAADPNAGGPTYPERAQVRLDIAEADERQMEEWRHLYPADVNYEVSFYM